MWSKGGADHVIVAVVVVVDVSCSNNGGSGTGRAMCAKQSGGEVCLSRYVKYTNGNSYHYCHMITCA